MLCGFMGAGKSFLLKCLRKTGPDDVDYFDLDRIILKRSGYSTIFKMIRVLGEDHFRALEGEVLRDIMGGSGKCIISLGGGTLSREFMHSIHRHGGVLLVWLDTSLKQCLINVERDGKNVRPLIKAALKGGDMGKLEQLYCERRSIYLGAQVRMDFQQLKGMESYHQFMSEVQRQLVEAPEKSDNG